MTNENERVVISVETSPSGAEEILENLQVFADVSDHATDTEVTVAPAEKSKSNNED